MRFMQLNPARGRKPTFKHPRVVSPMARFMQLNPARGRKHELAPEVPVPWYQPGLCSSTPRGDGNHSQLASSCSSRSNGLCSSTPRGDGNNSILDEISSISNLKVYAAQPREGTETSTDVNTSLNCIEIGLCSSTPRGDGNGEEACHPPPPAEGFMQLNPARGRKLVNGIVYCPGPLIDGLCSSTPRGDGNAAADQSFFHLLFMVYAAQPCEGTETQRPHLKYKATLAHLVYAAQPREGTETERV